MQHGKYYAISGCHREVIICKACGCSERFIFINIQYIAYFTEILFYDMVVKCTFTGIYVDKTK